MKRLITVTLAALIAADAAAAGFSTTDRSVVAMGSGGAGSVRTDDPGTNAYNAASAAWSRGFSASAGVVIAAPRLDASGVDTRGTAWSFESDGAPSVPPLLHVRYGLGDYAFGASLTVPFGSRVVWPGEWPGRFELLEARLTVLRASAFAAAKFGPISVAAGPSVDFGSLSLARAINFIEAEGRTSIDTRANGFGVNAAVFYRASDAFDLGLSYQSRSQLSFEGYADFNVPPELSGRAPDQKISTVIRLPDRFTLGGLFRANDELTFVADLELVLWNTVDALVLDFDAEATNDVVQRRDWKTTVVPRAGAAWAPSSLPWLSVRAGFFFDPSPVPSATAAPSSPDSSRLGFSLGAGISVWEGLSIDAAYQLVQLMGVRSEMETASLASGVEYGGHIHLIGAAIAWRARE